MLQGRFRTNAPLNLISTQARTSTGIARWTHVRRVTAVETASRRSGISDSGEATSTEKLTPPPAKSRLWSTS